MSLFLGEQFVANVQNFTQSKHPSHVSKGFLGALSFGIVVTSSIPILPTKKIQKKKVGTQLSVS
jgi:hypothetical protein